MKDFGNNPALSAALSSYESARRGTPVGDVILDGIMANQILPPAEDPIIEAPVYEDLRQTVFGPTELHLVPTDAFTAALPDGGIEVLYRPSSEKHIEFHASTIPNLIMEGSRGTGKSHTMRWDAHARSMGYPGFKYLMLRRTMPELRKSHLLFLETEMDRLGGRALGVRSGNVEAHYPNKSIGLFGHCETDADVMKYLSAQFDAIYFDEITTFEWDMVTKIKTSCRVKKGSGLIAIVRGGTNPLGVSAEDVYRYFIGRDLTKEEDKNYDPRDWGNLHIVRDDNPHLDYEQYDKQFVGLSEAYRKAWQDGQWGVEGAYFSIEPRHFCSAMPLVRGAISTEAPRPAIDHAWMHVYRVLDFGWHDPTVCVWIAVLPDGREVPFQEYSCIRTPAKQVAREIKALSDGMLVIATIADPTLWDGEKEMEHCLAFEFENEGIPLIKGKNDRTACGQAIQEHLNVLVKTEDGDMVPKLQFIMPEDVLKCPTPTLVRALKAMRVDKLKPNRIADHKADHMPIALGYFCMAGVGPPRRPRQDISRPWMNSDAKHAKLGAKQVRNVRRHSH